MSTTKPAHETIIDLAACLRGQKFHTVLADPPWRFANRTGKMAPEHRRLSRYETMSIEDICAIPAVDLVCRPLLEKKKIPNALLPWGLQSIAATACEYKSNASR